jgi:hypothetical protein
MMSTKAELKALKWYVFLICLFKEAELNCVNTYILPIFEFRQLEMGMSTSLYLPAMGTAGLLLVDVNGDNLDPAPPPSITAITFLSMV